MLMAVDNGFQACIMAPTEILAQQHFTTISEELKGMGILGTDADNLSSDNVITVNGNINLLNGTYNIEGLCEIQESRICCY